jgi:hypothetical protein
MPGTAGLSQDETFTALLDGMDSGLALSYSPFFREESMERRLAAILVADAVD